jgi:transposase
MVFKLESWVKSRDKPRLLIMDGHGSHIIANMIALCMDNNINLLILPPHCLHLL